MHEHLLLHPLLLRGCIHSLRPRRCASRHCLFRAVCSVHPGKRSLSGTAGMLKEGEQAAPCTVTTPPPPPAPSPCLFDTLGKFFNIYSNRCGWQGAEAATPCSFLPFTPVPGQVLAEAPCPPCKPLREGAGEEQDSRGGGKDNFCKAVLLNKQGKDELGWDRRGALSEVFSVSTQSRPAQGVSPYLPCSAFCQQNICSRRAG